MQWLVDCQQVRSINQNLSVFLQTKATHFETKMTTVDEGKGARLLFYYPSNLFCMRAVLKIGEYLVNKALQVAGMSADNVCG